MSSVAETVLRLESHCQIPDSDLNKPVLAMIPKADRAEFVERCAERKTMYSTEGHDRYLEYMHGTSEPMTADEYE